MVRHGDPLVVQTAHRAFTDVLVEAPDALLDSYEAERVGFARRLVATTDRVFSFATAEGRIADILRTRIAPVLFPLATHFEVVREFMFRTVSQVMLNYRDGPLSRGVAGHVHGGDRLPWVAYDGVDNFAKALVQAAKERAQRNKLRDRQLRQTALEERHGLVRVKI